MMDDLLGRIGEKMSLLFDEEPMPDESLRSLREDFLIRYAHEITAIVNAQGDRDQKTILRLKDALTVTTATDKQAA